MRHFAMEFSFSSLELTLNTPFRIAHGTSTTRTNVLLRFGDGVGEGALPPYYPWRFDEVRAYLEAIDPDRLLGKDPLALEDALDRLPPGPAPAHSAIDLALHDHWGKQLGLPLYCLWGLSPTQAPPTSITLSIPEQLDDLPHTIQAFDGFPILKLKLGTGSLERDEAIVRTAREVTDAQLCVDANSAWSIEDAARIIPRLARYDLLFIEQPLPPDTHDAWRQLRRRLPDKVPPLIADESIQTAADVLALADIVDGINLKLTKAGGLRATRRLMSLARALNLKVMLGCMIESSVALTAAAHLAPLADFADLDSYLHLADDPFDGVTVEQGRLVLPDRPGLGIVDRL
ncbi:MAG: mandelate racemase/muconate lactonizing enzyme family protein [Rhodothermales bacterium]